MRIDYLFRKSISARGGGRGEIYTPPHFCISGLNETVRLWGECI